MAVTLYMGLAKFTGKIRLPQVQILLQKYNFALLSATTDQNQILVGCKKFLLTTCKNLIRTELIREWGENGRHHFSTHFPAMLKNKLLVFDAPFATALLSTYLANFMISTFQKINF